jgi:hypothetical protein
MTPISHLKNDLIEEAKSKTLQLIEEEVIETYDSVPELDKNDTINRKSSSLLKCKNEETDQFITAITKKIAKLKN